MWLISACSPENKSYNGDLQTFPAVLPAGVFCVLAKYQHFGCITIDYYYFIFFIFSDIYGPQMKNPLTFTVVPTHGWHLWG